MTALGIVATRAPRIGRRRPVQLDWSAEKWTRGCYFGQPTPGAWTHFGRALREPCGKIHWAGAETAVRNGYMDGAVESGERAAQEVSAALDATK